MNSGLSVSVWKEQTADNVWLHLLHVQKYRVAAKKIYVRKLRKRWNEDTNGTLRRRVSYMKEIKMGRGFENKWLEVACKTMPKLRDGVLCVAWYML